MVSRAFRFRAAEVRRLVLAAVVFAACQGRNTEPEVVAVYRPSVGGLDTAYAFTVVATDPNGDRVAVRCAWWDGDTSEWSDWAQSGESISVSHVWTYIDVFRVKAQARDEHGSCSRFDASLAREITITNQRWATPLGFHPTCTGPAVGGDGTILHGAWGTCLSALYPDGTSRWRQELDGTAFFPVVGPDGMVYVNSTSSLWAFTEAGAFRWCSPMPGWYEGLRCPAVGKDGTVYATSEEALVAFDPAGSVQWCFPTGSALNPTVSLGPDGTVYVAADWDAVYAVGPDGETRWSYPAVGEVTPIAVDADGSVVFGVDRALHAVSARGELRWRCTPQATVGPPVIGPDRTIYLAAGDHLIAVDSAGRQRWSTRRIDTPTGCPAVGSDSTVYVGTSQGLVYAVRPDGTIKWHIWFDRTSCGPLTLVGGTLLVGTGSGTLVALNIPGGLADAPWPMFQHDAGHTGRATQ